jgi:hypothetical protein
VPVIFVEGNYFGTPLFTMCRINVGGDKDDSENKGRSWGGGGGADTRRKGLKENSM